MTYTKEQLEAMSDFEINKALLLKVIEEDSLPVVWFSGVRFYSENERIFKSWLEVNDFGRYEEKEEIDYCENWSDIMPLAVEHGIDYCKYEGGFVASNDRFGFYGESLQRAIACCLLVMEL